MAYLGNAPVVGDSTNSFRLLDDIASFTLTFDATDTAVVSIANDTLSFTNHRFVNGQKVTYTDGGGTAIGGLTDGTSYFIIKVDQNTIKLATNASNAASSTAINLTSGAAGGSHTLNVKFDGVNTKFKATFNNGKKAKISRAAQLSLSINGVVQQPQDSSSPSVGYGVEADSTIVFSTAPVATDVVFGSFIGEVAASFDIEDNTVDNFTGDGSTTIFNLSKEVPSSQDVLVTIDGVTQYPSDGSTTRAYSVIDQALTFVSAPADGAAIQARHIGFAGATSSAVTGFYGRTGNTALISTDDISVQNISGVGATFTGNLNIEGVLTYEDVTNVDSIGIITARAGVLVGSGITLSKDGDGFFTGIVTATSYYGDGSNLSNVTSTTINNNADNRLITGSGTANTLNGESTLTYDGTNLDLGDSKPIRLGAGQDLTLYHDGSNSYIDNNTGTLNILSADELRFYVNNSEYAIRAINNGAVNLYYDNSKKLETTNTGVTVTGNVSPTGNLTLADGGELYLGAGGDIRMFHANGNANFIQSYNDLDLRIHTFGTTASLRLQVNESENAVVCVPNGATELYHNGTKNFETHSAGVKVSAGNLYLDRDSAKAVFGASDDLELFHNGTDSYAVNKVGKFRIGNNHSNEIKLFTNDTTRWNVGGSGHIYPDLNNTYDIGTSTYRVRNLYTNDLNLSNEGGSNDVDGTWGDYTIQEGESDLFLINNRSGKKYKFNLTEVS